jgi:hypothetical protein
LRKGKSIAAGAGAVPGVPPEPKTLSFPTLNAPSIQSKLNSFRLFWAISTNFVSISTWVGPPAKLPPSVMIVSTKSS